MLIDDNSQPGSTRDRRWRILTSFGHETVSTRRHPLRRWRGHVLRPRAAHAIAALAVVVLMVEFVAILVIRH